MPEGETEWNWAKYVKRHRDYEQIAMMTLNHLKPREIYEYVHRASPRQSVQDRQVEKAAEAIEELEVGGKSSDDSAKGPFGNNAGSSIVIDW